jgi:hypothetical protein
MIPSSTRPAPDSGRRLPCRALSTPRRSRPVGGAFAALSLCLALGACSGGEAVGAGSSTAGKAPVHAADANEVERAFLDLISELTPPPATASSQMRQEYFERRREVLAELDDLPIELGERIARDLEEQRQRNEVLRADLLEVAARVDPEGLADDLVELVGSYRGARLGEELRLRAKGAEVLARVRPQAAFDLLEPWIIDPTGYGTGPSQEILLAAWLEAAKRLEVDPSATLAAVATDLRAENPARHLAVSALGARPSELGRNTLRQVMLESTGNAYLRRKAAQAIRDSYPSANAIALFEEVADLEADTNFLLFLQDVIHELELEAAGG